MKQAKISNNPTLLHVVRLFAYRSGEQTDKHLFWYARILARNMAGHPSMPYSETEICAVLAVSIAVERGGYRIVE